MPRTVTTFQIIDAQLSLADTEWLRNSGLDIEILPPRFMPMKDVFGKTVKLCTGSPRVSITTNSPQEETWVYMYWGDRVYVSNREVTFNSTGEYYEID